MSLRENVLTSSRMSIYARGLLSDNYNEQEKFGARDLFPFETATPSGKTTNSFEEIQNICKKKDFSRFSRSKFLDIRVWVRKKVIFLVSKNHSKKHFTRR